MSTHLVKRSLAIAGHKTSVALEPEFWRALEAAAREKSQSVAALVAEIDAGRGKNDTGRSLASSIRVWLLERASTPVSHQSAGPRQGGGGRGA